MNKIISTMMILGMLCMLSVSQADFMFSSDAGFSTGGNNFNKYDIITTNGAGTYAKAFTALSAVIPSNGNIDAIQMWSSNTIIFSLDISAVIQGTSFHKHDLIIWDGANATLLWNGTANGLPDNSNLESVYIQSLSPLEFAFSLSEGAVLPGIGNVNKGDLVHFLTGSGFTGKDFDANARGVPAQLNLDAFTKVGSNQWVLSFDAGGFISGNGYPKADLISFHPTGSTFDATPYFDANAHGIPELVNLDAVSMVGYAPNAGFYAIPTIGLGPLTVSFADTSDNSPTSWSWDFGDSGSSNSQSPSHIYPSASNDMSYTVRLIASNAFGISTATIPNYIKVLSANTTPVPLLTKLPDVKLFMGQSLIPAFDLTRFNTGDAPTNASIVNNFLGKSNLSNFFSGAIVTTANVEYANYGSPTTGSNIYSLTNASGTGYGANKLKYSTYKIMKLPKIGLNVGDTYSLNMADYTYNNSGPAIPASFGNANALVVSDPTKVTASWSGNIVTLAMITASPSAPITVDVIASPNAAPPFGSDIDKERIYVYTNLMPNSTFSTALDTTVYSNPEYAPGRTSLASLNWIGNYTDGAGTLANGVLQIGFADTNAGIKVTPAVSSWINMTTNQWYTVRMRVVADDSNTHTSILYGYNNYVGIGMQLDVSGNVLFGVPTVWTWQETPFMVHGSTTTGYPQFVLKAGGAGNIYIDEIQILNAAPTLVDANRNMTRVLYPYGNFDIGNDTTGWGQELYVGSANWPGISVSGGKLLVDFTGATTGNLEGIKWTANNGVSGPLHAYTQPVTIGRQIGVRATVEVQSGSFNSIGLILVAAFGVQASGQQEIGTPPSTIFATAGAGALPGGVYRTIATAFNPYYQFQFGLRSDQPGVLAVSNVDFDLDQDDPNFGDGNLFP